MTLGYSQQFKDGTPSYFMEKILIGLMGSRFTLEPVLASDVEAEQYFEPKIHSIREDRHNRWFAGRDIHHVYNARRSGRICFLKNKCISTQRIIIKTEVSIIGVDSNGRDVKMGTQPLVMVDGRTMSARQVEAIAINDGFPSVQAFFSWFNRDFSGIIIHWTKHRY